MIRIDELTTPPIVCPLHGLRFDAVTGRSVG